MKIAFDTTLYGWSWGRDPKGRGYWMFEFEGCYEYGFSGTYTEAKKACKEYVKSVAPADYVGTVIVTVLP